MSNSAYYPPSDAEGWETIDPAAAGYDPAKLAEAVAYAEASETPWPRDLKAHLESGFFEPPPDNAVLGPIESRGGPNGLLLHGGRILARWGNTRQVDQTFSIAKSYLSLLAGIAVQRGLITDLDQRVGVLVQDGGFDEPQNRAVTWRQLLQNTSEWEGSLFGKADTIDRNRNLAKEGKDKVGSRALQPPGTHWEYNDVRVNRLSLSLLRVLRQAVPEVFREALMQPLGASTDWHWEGYETSWVEVDGKRIQSVPGGSHWGGGVFIHAEDQARVGLLAARDGVWNGQRLLPEGWMAQSTTPAALNPQYGFLWWLNTGRSRWPSASATSFCAAGAGGNLTWIDPDADTVASFRWMDPAKMDGFMALVSAAKKA